MGVVERIGAKGTYAVGPGLTSLTTSTVSAAQLTMVARPYLRDLVEEIGEDAGLAIPDGRSVVYVDQVQAAAPVQVQDWTGERLPMHTVAAGFVHLSSWTDDDVARYLAGPLEASTSHTLTEPAAITARIEEVRSTGYAWTAEEWADGINGAAAPIRDDAGRAIGAINLYGPTYRFPGGVDPAALGERLKQAADSVSRQLAHSGSTR